MCEDESCKGRLWTKGVTLTTTPIPDNHDADFADAETQEIYSAAKDLIVTSSSSSPSRIIKSVKKNATNSTFLRLSNSDTFRRALKRTKKVENSTPTAPPSLADLQLARMRPIPLKVNPCTYTITKTRSAGSSSLEHSRILTSFGSVLVGTLTQPSSLLNYFNRCSQSMDLPCV